MHLGIHDPHSDFNGACLWDPDSSTPATKDLPTPGSIVHLWTYAFLVQNFGTPRPRVPRPTKLKPAALAVAHADDRAAQAQARRRVQIIDLVQCMFLCDIQILRCAFPQGV